MFDKYHIIDVFSSILSSLLGGHLWINVRKASLLERESIIITTNVRVL